jgi:hypothetical protein
MPQRSASTGTDSACFLWVVLPVDRILVSSLRSRRHAGPIMAPLLFDMHLFSALAVTGRHRGSTSRDRSSVYCCTSSASTPHDARPKHKQSTSRACWLAAAPKDSRSRRGRTPRLGDLPQRAMECCRDEAWLGAKHRSTRPQCAQELCLAAPD